MTDRDLARQLRSKTLLPVYLLHGEEEFLMERAVKSITALALGDGDPSFNLHTFRGSEHKAEDVVMSANAFPFMAEKRVVVVREAEKLSTSPALGAYVGNPNPDCVLLLCATEIKASSKSRAKAAAKPSSKKSEDVSQIVQRMEQEGGSAAAVEFKPLKDAAAQQWVEREFQEAGLRITPEACTLFCTLIGTQARALSSQIEKIISAMHGRESVQPDDVYEHLGTSRDYNVFELVNAVTARDRRRAMDIATQLLRTEEPVLMLNLLFRQLLIVWKARVSGMGGRATDEEARAIGLAFGWQLEALRPHLGKFADSSYFDRCFEYILEADLAIKSQPVAPETAIMRLVARLTEA
ncbi:MAG TPA: DNA polymerase III subunit delta [Bacteroidota bacterium]|nr:DNA polymerase III subunit delta [Bacteroidota bacterium]